ncbi:MAG: large subunit ribosomal protein L4e [Candidatus Woesearchaeota archaeon]|nr:large subunit ribosomal protein L4e [Candidatus Woesearchaeota archaeon]MDN5327976.1 large subunit ribosomal protein L4e [Candidatus Woesearchaeota archaeon]
MELTIVDFEKKEVGKVTLPRQFEEAIRLDLIHRAFVAKHSALRQRYGADPRAGKRYSAKLSRRRRDYKGSYGFGISRVPRKILVRRGTRMYWVGAFAPGTVGGRRAHPPKSEKVLKERLNKTERKKALRSALAATLNKELSEKRGHIVPEGYPFGIIADFENVAKTKEVFKILQTLGFGPDLERAKKKKIRAGKGKNRGRPYKKKKSVLLVVSQQCPLLKSGRNLPGVDVVVVNQLNNLLLAPGGFAGRLTLFTESAIKKIAEENLFM